MLHSRSSSNSWSEVRIIRERTHFTSKVAATRECDLPEALPPTILKGAVPCEKDDDVDGARTWGKSGREEAKEV